MPEDQANGIATRSSKHSVDETVKRLQEILRDRSVTLFALIDHSGEAAKIGMKMPPTKLLIFGNPRGGTPIMQAAPSAAIDLPLKLLVAEDPEGRAWISWNDSEYLRLRHGFHADLTENIALAGRLAAAAAE